jgi:hypothetical protein
MKISYLYTLVFMVAEGKPLGANPGFPFLFLVVVTRLPCGSFPANGLRPASPTAFLRNLACHFPLVEPTPSQHDSQA